MFKISFPVFLTRIQYQIDLIYSPIKFYFISKRATIHNFADDDSLTKSTKTFYWRFIDRQTSIRNGNDNRMVFIMA